MYDVITIGSATRDAFFEGLQFDYHPHDPHLENKQGLCFPLGAKMRAEHVTFTTGGAGTNTAITFGRQGLKAAAIVRVGADVSGREVRQQLEKEQVETSFFQVDASLPTSYSVILMAERAERTILVYKGSGGNLSAKEIPWEKIKTRWIYLNSISANRELLEGVIEMKQTQGVKLAWNPGSKDLSMGIDWLKPYLASLDVFLANKDEVSGLLGISIEKETEIFALLDELIPGVAIMTKGPEGVVVSDGTMRYTAGTFPEKALVDRTGAGDAFGSGFVVGYLRGGIREGIRVGSANSTSVLEHIGAKAGILYKKDIDDVRWQNLIIKENSL